MIHLTKKKSMQPRSHQVLTEPLLWAIPHSEHWGNHSQQGKIKHKSPPAWSWQSSGTYQTPQCGDIATGYDPWSYKTHTEEKH